MIAGADGCRVGWVIATRLGAEVVTSLADREWTALGIDMPIGLPDHSARSCDRAARRVLGPRRSSVFPAPARACLDASDDYHDASARNREALGVGLPLQAFHLLPKIREVDRMVGPADDDRIAEVHPECSFALLAGHPLPSKRTPEGVAVRRALVEAEFGALPAVPRGARIDDLLDAYAVLWSTERFRRGEHRTLGDGERDARDLPMRIVS